MTETEKLRLRVGEQRKEINRLKELNDRAIMCESRIYFVENKGDPFCARMSVTLKRAGFCSYGDKNPTAEKVGRLPVAPVIKLARVSQAELVQEARKRDEALGQQVESEFRWFSQKVWTYEGKLDELRAEIKALNDKYELLSSRVEPDNAASGELLEVVLGDIISLKNMLESEAQP